MKHEPSEFRPVRYPCRADGSMQRAVCRPASGPEPRPLLVALHTWSYDCSQPCGEYIRACAARNWHFIFPDFRGPNMRPEACGSELAVSDITDAVRFMRETCNVDPDRVYLIGGSGGGHATLLLAGRHPELWAAASAWCPISDIAAWHAHCRRDIRQNRYADDIGQACGGDPARSESARREAEARSPLTWLTGAAELPLDIATGIHDGHTGSVPVSQAIRAFNRLAAPADRIAEEEIAFMAERERVPEHLAATEPDPAFGAHTVYLRRVSGKVRLTLFEGGHDLLPGPGIGWLAKQRRGVPPDWSAGEAGSRGAGFRLGF